MKRIFPAQWHQQWGVLLAWPHASTDWINNLDAAEICYTQIIQSITHYANVLLLCRDENHQNHITKQLTASETKLDNVYFVQCSYNDTWARDFGFITVLDETKPVLQNFTFNAWGNKFDATLDNGLNHHLMTLPWFEGSTMESHELIMEGGSLETDGLGTLLTTEICLLNPNRNPELTREQIETRLKSALGLNRILWLKNGHIEGDDTDAHIDTLARFSNPSSIIYMTCDDPTDSHYPVFQAMQAELQALRQANGMPYNLYPVPMPAAIYDEDRRLPASYVNFLVCNSAVLLPIYNDARTDAIAIAQTQAAFPDYTIIPIDCCALIVQNGSLHCATMQIPIETAPNMA